MVALSGGGARRILYMNTCDQAQGTASSDCFNQQWPRLIVQNMTFKDGNSTAQQTNDDFGGPSGGGAIFDLGGQLKVVDSRFIGNRCFPTGPDLGGAAIRALSQWENRPVYITSDTFRGGACSNGGALSSIGVSWVVLNSVMTRNQAIGSGANPARSGTPAVTPSTSRRRSRMLSPGRLQMSPKRCSIVSSVYGSVSGLRLSRRSGKPRSSP